MADIASWIQILVTLKLIRNWLKSFLKENSYSNEPYIYARNELFTSYFHAKWIIDVLHTYIATMFTLDFHNVKLFDIMASLHGGQNLTPLIGIGLANLPKQNPSSHPHTFRQTQDELISFLRKHVKKYLIKLRSTNVLNALSETILIHCAWSKSKVVNVLGRGKTFGLAHY